MKNATLALRRIDVSAVSESAAVVRPKPAEGISLDVLDHAHGCLVVDGMSLQSSQSVGRVGRPGRAPLGSLQRVDARQKLAQLEKEQALITGVHHFSLSVADVDRSMAFYRELGFELVSDRDVDGDYVEVITGVPGAEVRITHLTGFGHNLELLEYRRPRGASRARELQDVGSAHVCLLTDDLEAECERLRALGVPFRSPGPVTTTSGPNQGGKGIYVEDPDGNAVEIIQLARPWGPGQDAGLGSDA